MRLKFKSTQPFLPDFRRRRVEPQCPALAVASEIGLIADQHHSDASPFDGHTACRQQAHQMAMGPLEAFARRFKHQSSSSSKEKSEERDGLSDALAQTSLNPSPTKPLPNLPPARTPSQFNHQRSNQLPHSISFQPYTYNNAVVSQQQYRPMPISNPYHPSSISIDHLKQPRLLNPWELTAPVPASSLPPSLLTPIRPPRPVSVPALPTVKKPTRRGKDIVTDPFSPPGQHQCWGIKRDGSRCTRRVGPNSPAKARTRTPSKSPSPSKGRTYGEGINTGCRRDNAIVLDESESDIDDDFSEDDERREYCHQHSKEINKTNGFILPGPRKAVSSTGRGGGMMGDGTYVDFERYLSDVVGQAGSGQDNCKARLRTSMCQPPSDIDWIERGYIYIYELRDRSTSTHIALKVGRAVNVFKRIEQWRSQCQSKSPLLRAFFPRPQGVPQDVLPGAASVFEKGVLLSHKWERLCHIELSFLGKRLNEKCKDCGSRHREIFHLPREVGFDGARRVTEKWLSFVRLVASDGLGGR